MQNDTIATQHPLLFVGVCVGSSGDPYASQGNPPKNPQTSPTILCWAEHSAEANVLGLVSTGGTEAVVMERT